MEIFKGDSADIPVQLNTNSLPEVVTGATVQAALKAGGSAISPIVTCSESHPDADWATGLIVVEFSTANTNAITTTTDNQLADLEIQVTEGSDVTTWLIEGEIRIRIGVIP